MKSKKAKPTKLILLILGLGLLSYFLFGGNQNFYRYWKYRTEKNQLKKEIRALQVEKAKLIEEIERLKNNPEYIEYIARTQYNMGKKGEKVIKFSKGDNK